jgi:hypothetical protein
MKQRLIKIIQGKRSGAGNIKLTDTMIQLFANNARPWKMFVIDGWAWVQQNEGQVF